MNVPVAEICHRGAPAHAQSALWGVFSVAGVALSHRQRRSGARKWSWGLRVKRSAGTPCSCRKGRRLPGARWPNCVYHRWATSERLGAGSRPFVWITQWQEMGVECRCTYFMISFARITVWDCRLLEASVGYFKYVRLHFAPLTQISPGGEARTVILFILELLHHMNVAVHVCACVSHACPCQGLWVLHLCSPYFRGDDKGREMSFLSEEATIYCLVYLLVQKRLKNTNGCIFMVVMFHAGPLLCSAEMIPPEATKS